MSATDIPDLPAFGFTVATINLQTMTEPLNDGKGRRVVDLDTSNTEGSQRSISRLAGMRQIIGNTSFGTKQHVHWLLQEAKCPTSSLTKLLRPLDQRFLSSFLSYDAEDSRVRRAKGTSAIITISTRHHIDTPPDFVLRLPGVQDIVMRIEMEPQSGKTIGIVSNYSSSIPKSTRHETLLINSPHEMPASQAYTVWDQVLNILNIVPILNYV